jgi:hypothetical protein
MSDLTSSASRAGKRGANRFEAVSCQGCGRKVKRKSRQQRYCSDRCRVYAQRENKARTALKNPVVGQDSGSVTNPIFLSNELKGLQGRKSGSSIPLNVLGGYRWPNAVGVERDTLRKIVRAEIGAWVREKAAPDQSDEPSAPPGAAVRASAKSLSDAPSGTGRRPR